MSLRCHGEVGRLRRPIGYAAVRRGVAACIGRPDFRVVHVSIQGNHIHLVVEAHDKDALGRGMRAFMTATARRLNVLLGRRGPVFVGRYHITIARTPRQTRNLLAYVLNNWRRHREHLTGPTQRRARIDPYSSAIRFDGWRDFEGRTGFPASYEPLPVAGAHSWLLTAGWRKHYPTIGVDEVPGPRPRG